jgi:hypothetical protein
MHVARNMRQCFLINSRLGVNKTLGGLRCDRQLLLLFAFYC